MSLQLHIRRQHWEGLGKRSEHMLFRCWSYSNSKDCILFILLYLQGVCCNNLFLVLMLCYLIYLIYFSIISRCKGLQFEAAWNKHRDDPNLTTLGPSFNTRNAAMVEFPILYYCENDNLFKNRTYDLFLKSQFHLL